MKIGENRRKSAAISISILEFQLIREENKTTKIGANLDFDFGILINSKGEWKSAKIGGDLDFDFGILINSRGE